jgi:hypothetical protein
MARPGAPGRILRLVRQREPRAEVRRGHQEEARRRSRASRRRYRSWRPDRRNGSSDRPRPAGGGTGRSTNALDQNQLQREPRVEMPHQINHALEAVGRTGQALIHHADLAGLGRARGARVAVRRVDDDGRAADPEGAGVLAEAGGSSGTTEAAGGSVGRGSDRRRKSPGAWVSLLQREDVDHAREPSGLRRAQEFLTVDDIGWAESARSRYTERR